MLSRLTLLLVCAALSARAQIANVLNETFADGDRTTQNLPASLAWYAPGAAVGSIGVRNNGLTLVANDNDRLIWGYFPARTIDIGDSLELVVDVTFNRLATASTGAFKIALCSTAGIAPRRTDGGPPIGGYQGYASFTNPGDGTAGTRLRKRNGPAARSATATILELNDGAGEVAIWDTFGASRTGLAGVLQPNTPYRVTLRITRTGQDSARVLTSISGGALAADNSLTETDTSGSYLNFDTVAIGAAESVQAGDLTLSRIQINHEVNTARLSNLSLLTAIAQPGEAFTLGYVIGGAGTSGAKPLLIRAAGPSLGALGVGGTLDDPKIELFGGAEKSGENDNWGGSAALVVGMAQLGAFAYAAPDSRDAAAMLNVTTPVNSVRVLASGNGTGTVIAELYDASPAAEFRKSTPRLVNVSVLKEIGTRLIVGFVIAGEGSKTVLIRAVGPTLGGAPFSVAGVVSDPRVELFRGGDVRIAENDNWGGTPVLTAAFDAVGAFRLPAASRDAALLATLGAGSYTVEVTGVGGTTGTALVEVYEVP